MIDALELEWGDALLLGCGLERRTGRQLVVKSCGAIRQMAGGLVQAELAAQLVLDGRQRLHLFGHDRLGTQQVPAERRLHRLATAP